MERTVSVIILVALVAAIFKLISYTTGYETIYFKSVPAILFFVLIAFRRYNAIEAALIAVAVTHIYTLL